ncbi:hypothetical protein D3C72_2400770 [compost metagenome]
MAALAAGLVEQPLAREHRGRIDIAACRHAQVAAVEQHAGENAVADFRFAAVVGATAVALRRRAVVGGDQ